MPPFQCNRYYRYPDLTRILEEYAAAYPLLVRLESIGQSHEGRAIWLVTVTRFATGGDQEKLALWVDGNIHAVEVAPSSACLYLLDKLVTAYGEDPDITRCLDTRAFYICPRVSPDGAEWALADRPRLIRSSTRPYPYDEEPLGGLEMEDVDGDGRILTMRVPDPNGPWKVCPEEPRLLMRREPAEIGGQYYRLLPEGRIENYDGVLIQLRPARERLDLNRNFPARWKQEHEQSGAGPYPTSEPEVRAVTHFVASHPNIVGGVALHTFGGLLARPYADRSDTELPAEDLWTYQKIGQKGTALTGYPAVSIYHDLRFHPQRTPAGGEADWLYDHLGVFAWGVEMWSPHRQAGLTDFKLVEWFRDHPLEDELKMLRWSDEALGGRGYVDWYAFDHPQLGPVELGGWDQLYTFANPPPDFLTPEVAPLADWLVWHLLISPRLELLEARARPLGEGVYHVRVVLHNTGWLPTYVTKKALEKQVVRGVVCEIELPAEATLETGELREELDQLEGRAYKDPFPYGEVDATEDRLKVAWTVRAPQGGVVKVTARHPRAGVARAEVELAIPKSVHP